MLINHEGQPINMVGLVWEGGHVYIDQASPNDAATIRGLFVDGTMGFDKVQEQFRINGTHWTEKVNGHPVAWVSVGQPLGNPFFIPREWVEKSQIIGKETRYVWKLEDDNTIIRFGGAIPKEWTVSLLSPRAVVTRIDPDHEPSDPDELEVEQDEQRLPPTFSHYPVMNPHDPNPLGSSIVEEGNVKTILNILPKSSDLFKASMERSQEHNRQLRETFGDDFVDAHTLCMLTKRYEAMLRVDSEVDGDEHRFGQKTSINHIRWMLREIHDNMEQSLTKKHRWIGFVQGLMIAYGYTTVDRERENTRNSLNGR